MSPACRATRKQKPESRLPERLVVAVVVVVQYLLTNPTKNN